MAQLVPTVGKVGDHVIIGFLPRFYYVSWDLEYKRINSVLSPLTACSRCQQMKEAFLYSMVHVLVNIILMR